jgi:hypothetical protein
VAENTETPPSDEPFQPIRPWSSFLIRDYRLIWVAILCANTSMHMRNVTSLYQVYHLSGSSLQLGLTGFFQAFPSFASVFSVAYWRTLSTEKK